MSWLPGKLHIWVRANGRGTAQKPRADGPLAYQTAGVVDSESSNGRGWSDRTVNAKYCERYTFGGRI